MAEPSRRQINTPSQPQSFDPAPELHPTHVAEVYQAEELAAAAPTLNVERFRTMFDAMLEGVQILDHNWRYLYLNTTAAQHNRRPNQELIGQVYMDMWPGIEATSVFTTLKLCLEEHIPAHIENEFIYPDGQIGWFELRIQPIPEGIFILSFDITSRKQAEIALCTSQAIYQNLFDNNPHPMWVYDVETLAFLMVNDAAIAHYGYSRTEFLGLTLKDIRLPEEWPALLVNLAQPPTPLEKSANWRHRQKDGSIIDVEIASHAIQLGGREARLVMITDVTQRRQTEEKLRESERQMQALVTSLDDLVFEFDEFGTYLNVWTANESLLAQPKAHLIGHSIVEILGEESGRPFHDAITRVITSGIPETIEYSLDVIKGKHWFIARISPVPSQSASRPTVAMLIHDISIRKWAEEKLQISERTLKLFVEYAPAAIAMFDRNMCYIAASRRFIIDYRLGEMDIIGRSHYTVFPEISDRWKAIHQRCLAGAIEKEEEDPFPRADGSLDWVKWEIHPWYEQNGEIGGIILFSEVITKRKEAQLALKASEERLRLVLETTADGFWIVDTQARFVAVNQAYCTMSGFSREELLQQTIMDVEAIESPQDTVEHIVRIKQKGGDLFETRHRRKDGTVFDVEVMVNLLEQEQPLMVCFCRDITSRKQAEVMRRKNEALLREAQRLGHIGHWEWNAPEHNLICSDELLHILELPPTHHVISQEFFSRMLVTGDRERLHKLDKVAFATHSDLDYEFCIQVADGRLRWLHQHAQVFYGDDGRPYRMLGIIQDITERKQTQADLEELNHTLEERVRERTAQLQDLYDNAPNGYYSLDDRGRVLMINQTFLNWLGYSRDELIGTPISNLLTGTTQGFFAANFEAFKQRGVASEVELDVRRKDGTLLPVLIDAIAVYAADGQFLHSRTTALDMTERRKVEIALRESRDELRTANEALAKASRLKDEFLANMSHELRTPLNSILNFSESLLEQSIGPLNEQQQEWIRYIETSGQHLLSLINDILDLSKVEAGQMSLQMEAVSVAQLCQTSLLFVKEMALKKQVALTYQLNDQLAEVQADVKRLKQILVNLLSNAVKFTPPGGKVRLGVTVDTEAGVAHYVVEDTGIGIAAADLERLFQPFTQLDSSLSRQYEGTGLGLALVRRLIALHNGTLSVQSEPGKGSRFTVSLPSQPSEPPAMPASATTPSSHPSQQTTQGARILLAEDNELNILAFTDYLRAQGYQITVAHNGVEAIALATEIQPHLILMDIQMPEMDGLECIRHLRATTEFAQTPIVALTALAMSGDRERCLAAGADAYLTKPIGLKKLKELIQTLLTR